MIRAHQFSLCGLRLAIVCLLIVGWRASVSAEIRDVLKSAEIDAMLAKMTPGEQAFHTRPNFAIFGGVRDGSSIAPVTHKDAGTFLHIRRGRGTFVVGGRKHQFGRGDLVHVPRNTAYQLTALSGRVEYLAIRVFGDNPARAAAAKSSRQIPEVIPANVIDATFAYNSTNQPIGSTSAYSTNFVIYAGRTPPFEIHRECVDIAVVRVGSGDIQIGGTIVNPKEESPGEIRGTGVTGSRDQEIAIGDVVVLPRNEAHHQQPHMPRLGYILLKVWTD
jgi:mannose-6-phosphate isomerase-like protein (cupin superfamily)